MNKHVGATTGSVRQVFIGEGKSIKKLEELEDGGKYLCAGAEKFSKDNGSSMPTFC